MDICLLGKRSSTQKKACWNDCVPGRGISPSSIKHLRFLLRFLNKQKDFGKVTDGQRQDPRFYNAQGTPQGKYHPESMNQAAAPLAAELFNKSMMTSTGPSATSKKNREEEAVSPPTSPFPGLKLVNGKPTATQYELYYYSLGFCCIQCIVKRTTYTNYN